MSDAQPLSATPDPAPGDGPLTVAGAADLAELAAAWARRHPGDGAVTVLLDANHRVVALLPVDGGEDALPEAVRQILANDPAPVSALAIVVTRSGPPPFERPDDELRWEELQAACRRGRLRLLDFFVVGGGRFAFSVAEHAPTPAAWGRPVVLPDGHLDALRAVLDDIRAADAERGPDAPPLLAHVRGDAADPATWDLLVAPLGSGSPAEALLGFTAPATWCAIGVAAGGWAAPPSATRESDLELGRATGGPPSAHPDAMRIRATTVISRLGGEVTVLRWPDGTELTPGERGVGRIPEAIRCALGVPNPPPPVPTDVLFGALWLQAILAKGRDGSLSWHRAAALHPAVRLLGDGGRPIATVPGVVEAARALGRVWGWEGVRRWAAAGWLPDLVEPALARWMDDGMLARTLLGGIPPLAELLTAAASRTTPAAHRRVRAVLREVLGADGLDRW